MADGENTQGNDGQSKMERVEFTDVDIEIAEGKGRLRIKSLVIECEGTDEVKEGLAKLADYLDGN